MQHVLLTALSLIFIIILAGFLKHIHLFSKQDYRIASKIIMNVTLPALVIYGFSATAPDPRNIIFAILGFGVNWIMFFIGCMGGRGKKLEYKAVWLNMTGGFNIGAFVLPFVQTLLGPESIVACCLYDAGNSLMCNGGIYTVASFRLDKESRMSIMGIMKKLFSSVPFDAYLFMLILSIANLRLPDSLITFITPIANANTFMAMFMIGLMLDIDFPKETALEVLKIVGIRFISACLIAALFLLVNPLGQGRVIAMAAFAPMSISCSAFAEKSGGDYRIIGCSNWLTIMIALIAISCIVIFF